MRPTFIQEFQTFHQVTQSVHELVFGNPAARLLHAARPALSAVVDRLFFSGKCKICIFGTPCSGSLLSLWLSVTRSHNSANVTSGCFLISARRNSSAASSFRLLTYRARPRRHNFRCPANDTTTFPASIYGLKIALQLLLGSSQLLRLRWLAFVSLGNKVS